MGDVYLAQDQKLDRRVALKILPANVAGNRDRMDRFVREAKSAAALNHPNIAHVYEIGEFEGTHFIAMEFIDGETLREKIHREKTPLSKLLKYLKQVAAGLAKAHSAGIVHRDLKPDNIMVTRDEYAKVLDFGLAKLIEGRGDASATQGDDVQTLIAASHASPDATSPGLILGTIGYMSPEQASGRVHDIDHRSDIFSFGCILFEAATGKRAFEGKDPLDSLHRIVHAPTPQLKDVNPLAPDDLQRVVRRCLAKEPEKRYQSIREVAIEIDDLQQEIKDQTRPDHSPSISVSASTTSLSGRTQDGFWIAVLPLKCRGNNADLEALSEGLSEDIVTGLSRFCYLKVVARSSTLRFTSETADVRTVGKELGAHYILEGSIRQAGSMLRLAVQLVDTTSGTHLWAETYDRPFKPEDIFVLQDELVPRIVATVADQHGVLIHRMAEGLRHKTKNEYTPYEAVLSVFGFHERMSPGEHRELRDMLERVVREYPDQGNCWAMLETLYADEYMFGFNVEPNSLDRALAAAKKAIELEPTSNLAAQAMAQALFFRRDRSEFRAIAERTIALNRMDTATVAVMGLFIACSGDWKVGLTVSEGAMQLNPNFPGWYRCAHLFDAYRRGDYSSAVEIAARVNIPGYYWTLVLNAATFGQLGQHQRAQKALNELLVLVPHFTTTAQDDLAKWFEIDLVEHLMEGLRKAGLGTESGDEEARQKGDRVTGRSGEKSVSGSPVLPVPSSLSQHATHSSINNGPDSLGALIQSIAVLPFQNLSGDTEQEFFADGITEEILNALAQIRGLRVAGRSSSFSFKGRNEDLRSVGAQLNVGTILEGTLRRSGDRLRITAQLIDASNGYQLWSERYDRVIDDIFMVQDEIAATIASRLELSLNEQPAEQTRTRNIEAYELYLKGRALLYQRGLSISKAIECFNAAVALDSSYAQAWAGLADGYTTYGYSGYQKADEVMPKALDAARRALEFDPNLAEAHAALACPSLLYERDYQLAEREFVRAIELNPNYPQGRAWYGIFCLQWVGGRVKEAREEIDRLLIIDPLSPYANVMGGFFYSSSGEPSKAVELAKRGVELDPKSYLASWSLGISLEANEQFEEAIATYEEALAMSGRHVWALCGLASAYGAWGKPDAARAIYREIEVRSKHEYIQPAMFAVAASAVNEIDRAIELAQQAIDTRDPLFVMIARTWPQYNKLRTEERFLSVIDQLGLPNWERASHRVHG